MNFKNFFNNWVCVGADYGPYNVTSLFVSQTSCQEIIFNIPNRGKSVNYWIEYFIDNKIVGVLSGTSQSAEGFKFESKIRKAAYLIKLPIICIEDFPGNYREVIRSKTSLLIIEKGASIFSYRKKLKNLPRIIKCSSIRYDSIRLILRNKKNNPSPLLKVLWAGQPEFGFNLKTLKVILPYLENLSVHLLFRAHPDDNGYKIGAYEKYLNSSKLIWSDVTYNPLNYNFFKNISLVLTQFSSVGIEAGFYGCPTLNILFPDVGEKLLKKRTKSGSLISLDHKAAFALRDKNSLQIINVCLFDSMERQKTLSNFAQLYEINVKQLPSLLFKIKDIIPI